MRYQIILILAIAFCPLLADDLIEPEILNAEPEQTESAPEEQSVEIFYKDEPEDHYQAGKTYYERKQFPEAQKSLETFLETHPKHSDAWLFLSYSYLWQGLTRKSVEGFEKVLEIAPGYTDAKIGLEKARERLKKERLELAKSYEQLGTSFQEGEKRSRFQSLSAGEAYEKGEELTKEKKYDEAMKYITRALELDPKHVDARLRLGYLYLWKKEQQKAIEAFEEVLKESPEYADAKKGLEQAKKQLADLEKKEKPERPLSDKYAMQAAQWMVDVKKLDGAYRIYKGLYMAQPEDHEFTYLAGKLASWTGHFGCANYLLHMLDEKSEYEGRAHLGLAQQNLLLGRWGSAAYHLDALLTKAPDSGEGWLAQARLDQSIRFFCLSRQNYLHAFYLLKDEEVKSIAWRGFYDVSLLLEPSARYLALYAEEKEVDLDTKVDAARIKTLLHRLRFQQGRSAQIVGFQEFETGYQREFNLVQGNVNYDVDLYRGTVGCDIYTNPYYKFSGGVTFKQGYNSGDTNFPFRREVTFEPFVAGDYRAPFHHVAISLGRESYIIKDFQDFFSLFLVRTNLEGVYEYQQLPLLLFVGASGYYRVYNDSIHNEEARGRLWIRLPVPKYAEAFSARYQFEYGGFRRTETNYYSFQRQWQHFAIGTFRKSWPNLDLVEISYIHSWRSTRDLNQPVNAATFLAKQFIFTNKVTFKVRKVARKGFDVGLEGLFYSDTADYRAFLIQGELRWIF